MGIAFPLTPAPEKQKSSALARSGFFLFPRVFQCVCPANEQDFCLEKFQSASGHAPRRKHGCPPAVPAPSHCKTGWLPAGNGASPLSIAAVHHRDGGTGCTRSRLTGKTKATSFRLSTTVGRLCFGHYDIFSLMLGQDARADTIPFYADSPDSFLHLQKRCDTDNPRICYCGF